MSTTHPEITVTAAHGRLDGFLIVDVRQPEEFHGELGHISGSRLIPLPDLVSDLEAQRPIDEIFGRPDGRPLLVVCRSGNRSGQACTRLVSAGRTDVFNLVGGMLAWNEAGLPVVKPGEGGEDGPAR